MAATYGTCVIFESYKERFYWFQTKEAHFSYM